MKPLPPREGEHIRPDAIVNVIKKEPKDESFERSRKIDRHSALPKGIFWGIAALLLFFVAGFVISGYAIKNEISGAIATNLGTLKNGVNDLQNLDPQSAQKEFASLKNLSSTDLGGMLGRIGFLFQGGAQAIGSFGKISAQLTDLSGEFGMLETTGIPAFVHGDGATFIAEISSLQGTVNAINAESNELSSAASYAGGFSSIGGGDFYLSLRSQLASTEQFLNTFVPWIATSTPHHILVLFDNPSELRPGGGFLGSYADVTLASGTVQNVAVHDVADVDLAFKPLIVPPKPLQLEVKNFRPADANWFFDFPTSASETISFFERSGLYTANGTTFDAAIAVTPQVASDLLGITGPVTIGKDTFTADNLLVKIQNIVQNGQATNATYPKQVLRDLSSAIFTNLASSTADERQQITGLMLDWMTNRDVMVYFKDPKLESFADANGASGAVYQLPQNTNADYFAMADANINGGKSDLYVSSTVRYTAVINMDGTISDQVVLTREHNGNTSPSWWYKTTNQDYLQFFVPMGSTITNASGGIMKVVKPPVKYATLGYATDPLIAAIEGTEQGLFSYPGVLWHNDAGKEVFTTWSVIKPGATKQFTLDYSHQMLQAPTSGVPYQFVVEKQAGTNRHYTIEIDAPLGYQFVENGLSTFNYDSDDSPLPGRMVINLTLAKLAE